MTIQQMQTYQKESKSMTKEIELSPGVMATIGTLSAADSFIADDYVGDSQSESKARKIYALCSLKRFGSTEVHPLQDEIQFQRVLDKFTGPKGLTMLRKLTVEFFAFMTAVGNEAEQKPEKAASSEEAA